ncbi:transposase [Thiolapillus sp.]|uniref:ISAzo13-like element transposase-related protein n=1 Tax=Thiolapillus sp. TaxID=2017437 RepID=UPI0035ABD60A
MTEFSDTHQIRIRLAYYPPYHSKYNPVERLWGVLENHWRYGVFWKIIGEANYWILLRKPWVWLGVWRTKGFIRW